jgi:capsule biosynthesis phosphatase
VTQTANTIYVDLDGTICPLRQPDESYADLPAREDVVERLRESREEGFRIVVHTSRNMRTYNGDISLINRNTAPTILAWLDAQKVPFDGLLVGKPWPGPGGFYIDDRTVRPDEFVNLKTTGILKLLGGNHD